MAKDIVRCKCPYCGEMIEQYKESKFTNAPPSDRMELFKGRDQDNHGHCPESKGLIKISPN